MSLETDSQTDTSQEDDLRSALTNQHCRFVLHYFSTASEDNPFASVEDLSTAFASETDGDEDQAAVQFHHVALPKLSETGVVDYDALSKTVHYPGHHDPENRLHIRESESEYVVEIQ